MTLLLLKLTITPLVIAAATLAARRFGPAAGGWFIGLPLTCGPVALFVALEHGPNFAAHVSTGFVAGVTAQAAFVLGYVGTAMRGASWRSALAAGSLSFAVTGLALNAIGATLPVLLGCALAALVVGLRVVPARGRFSCPPTRFELPLRMAFATGLVLAITGFAATLGPGLSGTVTTYPLISTLLAVFVHRGVGAQAAIAVYRGLLAGLFALMAFAATLVLVLSRLPLATAFVIAIALALTAQLGSLPIIRRARTA